MIVGIEQFRRSLTMAMMATGTSVEDQHGILGASYVVDARASAFRSLDDRPVKPVR